MPNGKETTTPTSPPTSPQNTSPTPGFSGLVGRQPNIHSPSLQRGNAVRKKTDNPYETPVPVTENPYETPVPVTENPYETPVPVTENPYETPVTGSGHYSLPSNLRGSQYSGSSLDSYDVLDSSDYDTDSDSGRGSSGSDPAKSSSTEQDTHYSLASPTGSPTFAPFDRSTPQAIPWSESDNQPNKPGSWVSRCLSCCFPRPDGRGGR